MRSGKLTRALKFSIGSDGKIVDNGIARNNNVLGPRIVGNGFPINQPRAEGAE